MASRAMASQSSLGDTVHIKVGWLKQRVGEGSRPLLEFDDLKDCEFDGGATTFRTVKHTCSYPAPPHKVRASWLCSWRRRARSNDYDQNSKPSSRGRLP